MGRFGNLAFSWAACLTLTCVWAAFARGAKDKEPPALNPFSEGVGTADRDDAVPGYIELSDGTIRFGRIYLTRDKRLQIYDPKTQRQRQIPLRVIKEVRAKVLKEWEEREWRFKELAKDEKVYTGKRYPARECEYTVELAEDRGTITGGVSAVVYILPGDYLKGGPTGYRPYEQERYLLHKRDKGQAGQTLKQLVYVKTIKLGEEAFQEGKKKAGSRPVAAPAKNASQSRPE